MIPAAAPVDAIKRARGGFLRNDQDTPYVSDPAGDTVKTGKRKGEVKRLAYGSPSSRGKLIEDTWALNKWGERNIVVGFGVDLALIADCAVIAGMDRETPEFREAADRIVLRAKEAARSALAADRGSHTHALSEDYDEERDWILRAEAGEVLGLDLDVQQSLVDAWRDMLTREGLEVLAVEASCVDDRWRLAGTLDRIVRTTKPLRFVFVGGEVVDIPVGTVLILDIKSGKRTTRTDGSVMYWQGYAIQIASYAQSTPYDTDLEVRGEWPWPISQDHALIAHLDVLGALEGNPSCELIYCDIAVGREHGGATVIEAREWGNRRDVFSVAQLADLDVDASPTSEAGAVIAGPSPVVADLSARQQHDVMDMRSHPAEGEPVARGDIVELEAAFKERCSTDARKWIGAHVAESAQAGVTFHLNGSHTDRRLYIVNALITLAANPMYDDGDVPDAEVVRALLATVIGDVAWYSAITLGHLIGSLTADEARLFRDRCNAFVDGDVPGHLDAADHLVLTFA